MTKKLLICPWFGPLPPWFHNFLAGAENIKKYGYDLLVTTNLSNFNVRCWSHLGFSSSIEPGTGKLHDYRPALGRLFEEEVKGYDFWGHCDFDCAFGRVGAPGFLTEQRLEELDAYFDCGYCCGPWSLYRTNSLATDAFYSTPAWNENLRNPRTTGWAEGPFTRKLESMATHGAVRLVCGNLHRYEVEDLKRMESDGDRLMLDGREQFMAHFRRTKEWPANVRF